MRRRAAAAGLFAALLALTACSHDQPFTLPPPPTTEPPPSTQPPVDLSKISLSRVPGRTTTTVPVTPGPAALAGTVTGPDGPVGGATVQIVRLMGDGAGQVTVVTQPDGTWEAPSVLGGRYRVRAWLAPSLAQTKPEIFFLGGSEKRQVRLTVSRYEGLAVAAAVAPDPPQVGERTNLVVAVTTRTVSDDGVVRATPVARVSVELTGSSSWSLETANPTTTDFNGQGHWTVTCERSGDQPLSVLVGGTDSFPLKLPPCEVPPDTTTTSQLSTSTTRRTSTTS
jgi:hypothetical protein